GSLRGVDFAPGTLLKGDKGDKGDPGASGAAGAKGDKGDPGRSALTPLQSGETESGDWGVGINATGAGQSFRAVANFPIPLSAGLDSSHTIYVSCASATHVAGIGS